MRFRQILTENLFQCGDKFPKTLSFELSLYLHSSLGKRQNAFSRVIVCLKANGDLPLGGIPLNQGQNPSVPDSASQSSWVNIRFKLRQPISLPNSQTVRPWYRRHDELQSALLLQRLHCGSLLLLENDGDGIIETEKGQMSLRDIDCQPQTVKFDLNYTLL